MDALWLDFRINFLKMFGFKAYLFLHIERSDSEVFHFKTFEYSASPEEMSKNYFSFDSHGNLVVRGQEISKELYLLDDIELLNVNLPHNLCGPMMSRKES